MGKASRHKRETQVATGRPRWMGADGFDRAWRLTEAYRQTAANMATAKQGTVSEADAVIACLRLEAGLLSAHSMILDRAVTYLSNHHGKERSRSRTLRPASTTQVLGDGEWPDSTPHREFAEGVTSLTDAHQQALRQATPILFDPLTTPAPDPCAMKGLRLPFEVTTCDFLNARGMSMPALAADGETWVGVIAATFVQHGDAIDVWPVVTALSPTDSDDAQVPRAMTMGCVRFGGELGDPPPGVIKATGSNASVWALGDPRENTFQAHSNDLLNNAWIVQPALAAASALRLLEAVNVSLEPVAAVTRADKRRADRVHAAPALEVVVRTSRRDSASTLGTGNIDWQQRWTVRGHWKHFTKGPVFNANARKHVDDPVHGLCVKVWCPPFVKGPEGMPLVLKARRVVDTPLTEAVS